MTNLGQEWRKMQRRIVEQLKHKQAPDMGESALEVSPELYTNPERFERERQRVFRQFPLLAGLSSEVANAGSHITFDAAGVPILIVRGSDGELRAFLNICTHRGAKLSASENSSNFICPYHGWVFADNGSLKNVPLEQGFTGVDLSAKGLVKIPVAEWRGMVFVIAEPGEQAIDVEGFLDGLAPLLSALNLDELKKNAQDQLQVNCNWKLALDTGREIYHVPVVHRNTLAKNLYNHTMIYDQYGLHNRYCGAGKDFEELLEKPEQEWPEMRYQAVHYIYPNTTLAISHAVDGETPMVSISRIFPGKSVGETTTYLSTYSRDADPASTEIHKAVVGVVNTEDYVQAANVWENLSAQTGGFKLVWGRNEALLQQYHQQLAEHTDMPL